MGGEGELGVAASCSGKRVTLGFHVGLSAFVQIHIFTVLPLLFFQELVCLKASGIFDSMNHKLGKLFCFKFIVFVVKNSVML